MIKIRITEEEILVARGKTKGFGAFEVMFVRQDRDMYTTAGAHFYPTKRDLIFKRFDRWVAPWQNIKTILTRRFKP